MAPLRILLIEDDTKLRAGLRTGLERAGFHVAELVSGVGAESLVQDQRIDVVVTDLLMPAREGIETIIALRRRNPTLPIVAITGSPFESMARKLGANRTLAKPFALEQLVTAIHEARSEAPPGSTPVARGVA